MMNKLDILIVSALEIETQGQLKDWNVLYTGVGKVNATFKLTERLCDSNYYSLKPKLIINYGTAGSRKIKKKTLVDCTKFVQRDMDVTGLGFMRGQTPFENDIPIILDYDHVEFNPIGRKAGKLPPTVFSHSYETEYSEDTIQIKQGSGTAVIVDDVLATGGTL